jgi:hypothetical protein
MLLRRCVLLSFLASVAMAAICERLASLSLANTTLAAENLPVYCA